MSYGPFDAEPSQNKLPLTRAIPVLAKAIGLTQKKTKEVLLEWGPCEWHLTGKYNRRTDFYNVEQIRRLYCFDDE